MQIIQAQGTLLFVDHDLVYFSLVQLINKFIMASSSATSLFSLAKAISDFLAVYTASFDTLSFYPIENTSPGKITLLFPLTAKWVTFSV